MTELDKLEAELKKRRAEYERLKEKRGEQIVVSNGHHVLWDVICGEYSYGGNEGLLEVMGQYLLGHDGVKGWLTAEDVIEMMDKAEEEAKE